MVFRLLWGCAAMEPLRLEIAKAEKREQGDGSGVRAIARLCLSLEYGAQTGNQSPHVVINILSEFSLD